jgi:hypothetical protein
MFDLCAASRPQIKTKHHQQQQEEDKTRQDKKRKEKKIFVSDHEIQVAHKRRDVLGVRTVSLASLGN